MGVRGPDLAPVDHPAVTVAGGARAHAGEVGAALGLAHPDRAIAFAARNRGQEPLALLLGAEAQDLRAGLPIGDPARRRGRSGRAELLDDDIAFERTAFAAPVAFRPGHPDKAGSAESAAKGGVKMAPGVGM